MIRTYSFEDTSLSISHPDVGAYSAYGAGLGDVTITRTNDITTHETSADLSVLISRTAKKNGTITINVLQASEANDYFNKFCKYLETCDINRFALGQVSIKSRSTGESWVCTGVTHQKMPDKNYTATGQYVSYVLMSASVVLQ